MAMKNNPGMLLTLKENTACCHIRLSMPSDIRGGLAVTFWCLVDTNLIDRLVDYLEVSRC